MITSTLEAERRQVNFSYYLVLVLNSSKIIKQNVGVDLLLREYL